LAVAIIANEKIAYNNAPSVREIVVALKYGQEIAPARSLPVQQAG
jgi:hypothetical protein